VTDETTNPNRWTAEVHMQAGTNGREYAAWLYDGGRYIGKPVHGMEKDCNAFAKQINRPAPTAPADDLPPGVERDYHLTPNAEMPDGWRATEVSGLPTHVTKWGTRVPIERIPAEPATEWAPWWEAFNDELPLVRWGGQHIKNAQKQASGVFLSTWGLFPAIRVDADGKVEVQR